MQAIYDNDWESNSITPLPSTLVDPTHVSASTSTLGTFGAGVIVPYGTRCGSQAACAGGQSCVNGFCRGG